jgi:hypothetical protein
VQYAPYTSRRVARVSWFCLKTKIDGFSRFSLKTDGNGSCGLASKSLAWVSRFGELTHKITTTDSWFGPQNQVGYGLSVVLQNQREDEDGVGALIEF